MKKAILSALIPIFMATAAAFGAPMISYSNDAAAPIDPISPAVVDPNSFIKLFAAGTTSQTSLTVSAGSTFSLDTYIQITGYTAVGLSYCIEASTTNSFASHLTLSRETVQHNWNASSSGAAATTFAGST